MKAPSSSKAGSITVYTGLFPLPIPYPQLPQTPPYLSSLGKQKPPNASLSSLSVHIPQSSRDLASLPKPLCPNMTLPSCQPYAFVLFSSVSKSPHWVFLFCLWISFGHCNPINTASPSFTPTSKDHTLHPCSHTNTVTWRPSTLLDNLM